MWEIDNTSQFLSFLISVAFGMGYCLLYDLIRAVRKAIKINDITVFFQDVFYFVFITLITFMLLSALTNGEIRAYVILGLIIGFVACYLTLSRLTVKMFASFLKMICFCFEKIIDYLNVIINKVEIFFLKNIKNLFNWLKNKKNIKKALEKEG